MRVHCEILSYGAKKRGILVHHSNFYPLYPPLLTILLLQVINLQLLPLISINYPAK